MLYIILVIIFVVILWYFFFNKRKERYGNIKSFRRVPKNNCYDLCRQYYNDCMIRYQYIDAGNCQNRFNNCVGECNYSDFHKM